MPYTGKVAEIFDATILPNEGRQIFVGGHSLFVLKFKTYNQMDVAILVPSSVAIQTAFMCRCMSRWLLRELETSLKVDASLTQSTILVVAPNDQLDAIEEDLLSRGASIHSMSVDTDTISAIMIATVRAMLLSIDLSNPSFRTELSGETERLADLGVFNSTAGGDTRDVLLLSSWVGNRMTRIIGNPTELNLLFFGTQTPFEASPSVDGWVDDLFGTPSSCDGLDIIPMSMMHGDLLQIGADGSIADGFGSPTLFAAGGYVSSRCGIFTSPLEVGNRPRMLKSAGDPVPIIGTDGLRVPLTEVVSLNLETSDGAVVRVAENADLIILEVSGASMNGSRSGEDPIVGFYNEEVSEWQYIDTDGNNQSVPLLTEPYYCPDLNNASATILRVFRSVPATAAPQPAIREIKLILQFSGPVSDEFEIKIRQQSTAGDLGQTSDLKWPTGSPINEYGASVERVNFADWQPSPSSSYAIYRIETFNHTLWDIDPTDVANEVALTESYGQARSLLREFHAWREMSG